MVEAVKQKLEVSRPPSKQLPKTVLTQVATEMTPDLKNKGIGRYFCPPPQSSPSADIWKSPDKFESRPICPCNQCANSQSTKSPSRSPRPKPHGPSGESLREGLVVKLKSLKLGRAFKHMGSTWTRQNPDNTNSSELLPLNTEWREMEQISEHTDGQGEPAATRRTNSRRAPESHGASKTDKSKTAIAPSENNVTEYDQEMESSTSSSSLTDDGSDTDYETMAPIEGHLHF
jgi:hypothetical protein